MPTVNRGVNMNANALILRINILYSLKCDRSQWTDMQKYQEKKNQSSHIVHSAHFPISCIVFPFHGEVFHSVV
jgi:hypothetical protein